MLFPISKALINLGGLLKKKDRIFPESKPFLLVNSIFNRLAVTKAISIPEKNAENNMAIRMKII